MFNSSKTHAQPSPIGTRDDRDEDIAFMSCYKKRPHEDGSGGHGSNAGSKRVASDAGAIFRSVTADDDNAPVANHGDADFSSAILMGNSSASVPMLLQHDAVQQGAPNAQRGTDGIPVQTQILTANNQVDMSTATTAVEQRAHAVPAPLMPVTSPLQRQSVSSKPNDSSMAAAATVAKEQGQEAAEQTYVERWTCDVCKIRSFDTFEEANSHEISCKVLHDAKKRREKIEAPRRSKKKTQEDEKLQSALTSLVLTTASSNNQTAPTMHPSLVLIPSAGQSNILSQYNNLLVRNVEFFYPATSHLDYDNLSGSMSGTLMSKNRLGLRCIHCKDSPNHVTAAAFFPRTVGSIASGLGTIGTRHFGWGKCPVADSELVEQMMEAKKTSSAETRARGRIGLDAYCKDLASKCGIYDDQLSGICWEEGSNTDALAQMAPPLPSVSSTSPMDTDREAVAALLAGMKNSTNIETRSFIPTTTEHFWECNGCRTVPLDFRAKGSVVFSVGEPTNDQVSKHLQICGGNKPLTIPHNATIEPFYGEAVPPIKISWNQDTASSTAPLVASSFSSGRPSRQSSSYASITTGTEDGLLCFEEDKEYTTDFAYFTVTQLKKCYLTKEGGSRGSCPLGYPGLACGFCAGTANERRFFYTSADHLRNSFSHIPTHMNECSLCPQEVKDRLEEFKKVRSSQKSSLKVGYHKIFIDRLWQRLHGAGSEKQEARDTASSEGTDRIGTRMHRATQANEASSAQPEVDTLVVDEDKHLTTDLIFYTLQQLEPYKPCKQKSNEEEEEREIGFPGLVCRHCKKKADGRKFFTTSSEHLGDLLLTIANHVAICRDCPVPVKTQIISYQFTHDSQLQSKKESHRAYMDEAWRRLVVLTKRKDKPKSFSRKPSVRSQRVTMPSGITYPTVDPNTALVLPEDEQLVTPFTFYTMSQCRPCNLDIKGNGSRSNFEHGFPGLECKHCAGPNSRKFFYRSAEILAGNYAHIPNHLLSCAGAPPDLRPTLTEMKQKHQTLKHHLGKGSQKTFFANIWNRLHNPPSSSDNNEVAAMEGVSQTEEVQI